MFPELRRTIWDLIVPQAIWAVQSTNVDFTWRADTLSMPYERPQDFMAACQVCGSSPELWQGLFYPAPVV
jgi:hypothetical protein